MNIRKPSQTAIDLFLKSELGKIQAKNYRSEEIHRCICAYVDRSREYEEIVRQFTNQVLMEPKIAKYVHSVRFRIKNPFHLADKLARKCLDKKKPRNITLQTLFTLRGITDLGGVRILHLRREEWRHIHKYLIGDAIMSGLKLVKKIAYVDPEKAREYRGKDLFEKREIKTDSENGYTSLHYIFQKIDQTTKDRLLFECQVRTLFEEGWGEIDHQLNYPCRANSIVAGYLASLQATAYTANEVASKLDTVSDIPLFVPWDTELRLERSAEYVYCVTPDLGWVSKHLGKFVKHVREAAGIFKYFIIKNDDKTNQNVSEVEARLREEKLLNIKVFLFPVPRDKRLIPVISDLLLLENASDPVTGKERPISVVGAPPQRPVSAKERLDMIITEESAVKRLRDFFQGLRS